MATASETQRHDHESWRQSLDDLGVQIISELQRAFQQRPIRLPSRLTKASVFRLPHGMTFAIATHSRRAIRDSTSR
jgi:hypothetical protein